MPDAPSEYSLLRQFIDATDFSCFTPKGLDALDKQIKEYVNDLVKESLRTMEHHYAESITEVYVQHASNRINSRLKNRQYSVAGSLGGVFLGAAVSSFVDMANAPRGIEFHFVVIASAMAVVGATMMAINFLKE